MIWIENHPGLAAWVQAVGSLIAVGAAAFIAVWQTRKARESRMLAEKQRLADDREAARLVLVTVAKFVTSFAMSIGDKGNLDGLPHVRSVDGALEVYRETIARIPLPNLRDHVLCERVLVVQTYISGILDMLENLRAYLRRGGGASHEILARVNFIQNAGRSVDNARAEFEERLVLLTKEPARD